jgi:hypothetical protein
MCSEGEHMQSLKQFVSKELVPRITDDARKFRILYEADLQYRTAYHLDQRYVSQFDNVYLLNQPYIRIGHGRGVTNAKPDIVIVDRKEGPFSALELKSYLEDADKKVPTICDNVWKDIKKLERFKHRYRNSEGAFAIVLVDVTDVSAYRALVKELHRVKEPWMAHYLRVEVINLFCDENFRQRTRYEQWAEEWTARRDQIA